MPHAVAARDSWTNSPFSGSQRGTEGKLLLAELYLSFALKTSLFFLETEQGGLCLEGRRQPDPEAEPSTAGPLGAVNF